MPQLPHRHARRRRRADNDRRSASSAALRASRRRSRASGAKLSKPQRRMNGIWSTSTSPAARSSPRIARLRAGCARRNSRGRRGSVGSSTSTSAIWLEMRQQRARIVARFEPDRGRVGLPGEERVERDRGSRGSSSRKRSASTIDRLLERLEADAAIGVEEALARLRGSRDICRSRARPRRRCRPRRSRGR